MKTKNPFIIVNGRKIGLDYPTYFIADIAANHDGNLEKAKKLICLAKEAGADAAKFQHFRAEKIVSQFGFESMKNQLSHQSKWKKSVFQIYQEASVPWEWTPELKNQADKVGIDFFSAPYDLEAVDMLDPFVPAYKIGSGDINWTDAIAKIASKKKPVFLACGASTMKEVDQAVKLILMKNKSLCLMQCNTNYTGSKENFKHIHLNVLRTFSEKYPGIILGLSDHTPGCVTVLGAVSLGARAIEKHFTDDRSSEGPDHPFSMDPKDWREMVDRTRELEMALGRFEKGIAENEKETVIIQKRCIRAAREIKAGEVIKRSNLDLLRPATPGAYLPNEIEKIIGRKLRKDLKKGEPILLEMIR